MADARHPYPPDVSFDGGDLDCGNGLLLLIRQHIDPLRSGQLLEIRSQHASVEEDLPSWCRLTGNELVSLHHDGGQRSFLVSKGEFVPPAENSRAVPVGDTPVPVAATGDGKAGKGRKRHKPRMAVTQPVVSPTLPERLPEPAAAPAIEPLSVMGVGSWPRPKWLLRALHEHLQGRIDDTEFTEYADDAVRLAVQHQVTAGVDVVTDGEQRRDNYSSFVGGLLENCQLIPITDLLPYVDDPQQFERELHALDVPAGEVRHPAVFGPLGRGRSLATHEAEFVRTLTDTPVKVSLPGPYLLTRTMWMECVSDRAYDGRAELARDIVRILREEAHHLLAAGVSLVQFDEPVLTEVVHGHVGQGGRTFMCGALGERQETGTELAFARDLLQEVVADLPPERLALHVCRGNWTGDETKALAGDYRPLLGLLGDVPVGTAVLELCTSRAGEVETLADLPADRRIGVGLINQKNPRVESVEEVEQRAQRAINVFGTERVLFNTDCGFATFADNPIVTADAAAAKLSVLTRVRDTLRRARGEG